MGNKTQTHVTDLLAAFALNALDEDEVRDVSAHLETCAECYLELTAYQKISDQLALGAPVAHAPASLKARLEARTYPAPITRTGISRRTVGWKRIMSVPRPVIVGFQVAAAVLIISLGVGNLTLLQRIDRQVTDSIEAGLQTIKLTGTEFAPSAKGTLVISVDGRHGVLFVDGLPILEARRVYQAWLGEIQAPLNAGLIDLSEYGYGWLEVNSGDKLLTDYPLFRITVEPAGGSPIPSGNTVLLRSSP
jgi:anti-sigma-K factor RskA